VKAEQTLQTLSAARPKLAAPDPLRDALDAGKHHRFALEEWELYSKEPESLSVGQLNWAVRALREEHYQLRLKSQKLREALLAAREALRLGAHSCHCGARGESLDTHPHVLGCPTERALSLIARREE